MEFDSKYERRLYLQETVPLMQNVKEMLGGLSDNLIMFFAEEEKGVKIANIVEELEVMFAPLISEYDEEGPIVDYR